MARVILTDEERRQREADRDVVIHGPTLVHLERAVSRGHDNFVFGLGELRYTFPDIQSADVSRLARVLGEGWGVHPDMPHVLRRNCDKRDALRRLRGLLDGRE